MTPVRKIVANLRDPEEVRVAILEDGRLAELLVEHMWERQRAGEIYKARVDSVLGGMQSAFLNLGDGRNAFLHLADARGMEVRPNTEMLVQVVKAARKGKGARVSPRLALPGRHLVLVPGGHDIGVSRRIADDRERRRLRKMARDFRPEGFGLIVRTVSEGVGEGELEADVEELLALWREIEHQSRRQPAPCLLYRDLGLLGKVLRDELNDAVDEIVLDSSEDEERIRSYVARCFPSSSPEVSVYSGVTPLFDYLGIEREIAAALDRKVWLPSGAYLVVEQTEALTVIDVNTGKFVGDVDLRHTVLDTNLEAAGEIARQLRLRGIGGIVVVDFIDMDHAQDRKALLDRLEEVFRSDRCRAKIFGVTELGLVEITRKRARVDLRTALTRGCPECGGAGWVMREESLAMVLKRFLRKVCLSGRAEAYLLEVHPALGTYVMENCLGLWEEEFGRRFFLVKAPEFAWGKFRLDAQGTLGQMEHRLQVWKTREPFSGVLGTAIP